MKKTGSKIDSQAIITGKAKYTGDLVSANTLVIKLLRSPHAHAEIEMIDVSRAEKMEGVAAVYTYRDVPQTKFTLAGQSSPEPSPYDRLILDRTIRYYHEPVAIVAAETEKIAEQALRRIKVQYKVKKPLLDYTKAIDNEVVVHDEKPYFSGKKHVFGYDTDRNIAGEMIKEFGDVEQAFQSSDVIVEGIYYTKPQAHCMMETYRSFASMDDFGRLKVISSTQVPFHIKRQLARALEIKPSQVRIIKPRVGGGFGGKQTSVTEIYAGFVTWKTGRDSYIEFTRDETFEASNSRHQMKLKVKIGAGKTGKIKVIDLYALSDQGAYGEHCYTTLNLAGSKSLPMYRLEAAKFHGQVVYTNKTPGAAFRGYGAPQGIYAVEAMVNELANKLQIDPVKIREMNIVQEGDTATAFGTSIDSCKLEECIQRGKEMIEWDQYYPRKVLENGDIIAVGMAIAMQGSGIANVDNSTVEVRLNENGDFTLLMSDTDVGQGTDTIMVQIASEVLGCEMNDIIPVIADTDLTPFDPGSYASSGVYVTGNAVKKACEDLLNRIKKQAAIEYNTNIDWVEIKGKDIIIGKRNVMTLKDLATRRAMGSSGQNITGRASFGSKVSPPPYMAGFSKIKIHQRTGQIEVLDYAAVVDCGTVMNKQLAKVQVEGGICQGIGNILYEDTTWDEIGRMKQHNFFTYHLPTRKDIGKIHVDFCESYEPSGPFGAKSIGEIVVNTPPPAIQGALINAIDYHTNQWPVTAEDVLLYMKDKKD